MMYHLLTHLLRCPPQPDSEQLLRRGVQRGLRDGGEDPGLGVDRAIECELQPAGTETGTESPPEQI